MRHPALLLLPALFVVLPCPPALAFSDFELFAQDTTLGGGDRRYFTGSPVDGYSCAVCHRGGSEPNLQLTGLPLAGYVPGRVYEVEVSWTDPGTPHALQLELVNKAGVSPGVQLVPDGVGVDSREYCGVNNQLERATYLIEDRGRQILGVRDCRAAALHFRFTAPDDAELAFAATLVRSDSSASSEGDGVHEVAAIMHPAGPPRAGAASACSAAPYGRPGLVGFVLLSSVVALLGRRSRRADPARISGSRG